MDQPPAGGGDRPSGAGALGGGSHPGAGQFRHRHGSWSAPRGSRSCSTCRAWRAFDFSYQPSLDKKQVQTLASCHFVEHGQNLVILGPPGVGKTHLAVGLGLKAIEHGYRGLFTTAAALITTLTKAGAEGRLDEKLKLYTVPRLRIVDEIGYLPSTATAPTSSSNSSAGATSGVRCS